MYMSTTNTTIGISIENKFSDYFFHYYKFIIKTLLYFSNYKNFSFDFFIITII